MSRTLKKEPFHQKCCGLTRNVIKNLVPDTLACNFCDPQANIRFNCKMCKEIIRQTQHRATCIACAQPSHLSCTQLTRMEREGLKNGRRTWNCCNNTLHHPNTHQTINPTPLTPTPQTPTTHNPPNPVHNAQSTQPTHATLPQHSSCIPPTKRSGNLQ